MPARSSCIPKPASKKLEANEPDGVLTVPSIVTLAPSGKARAAAMEIELCGRAAAVGGAVVRTSPTATNPPNIQWVEAPVCLRKIIAPSLVVSAPPVKNGTAHWFFPPMFLANDNHRRPHTAS